MNKDKYVKSALVDLVKTILGFNRDATVQDIAKIAKIKVSELKEAFNEAVAEFVVVDSVLSLAGDKGGFFHLEETAEENVFIYQRSSSDPKTEPDTGISLRTSRTDPVKWAIVLDTDSDYDILNAEKLGLDNPIHTPGGGLAYVEYFDEKFDAGKALERAEYIAENAEYPE